MGLLSSTVTKPASKPIVPVTSATPKYGYQPTYASYGGLYAAPEDNLTWRTKAVDLMAYNIKDQGAGAPHFWNEQKYGSWAAIVDRNFGARSFNSGDYATLMRAMQESYSPTAGDWFQTNVGQYVAPTGNEYTISPEYQTLMIQQDKLAFDQTITREELDFRKQQAQMEMALRQQENAANAAYRSQSLAIQSQSAASEDAYRMAKIEMDWKIAQLQFDTQMSIADKQLAVERLKLDAQAAYQRELIAVEREQMAQQQSQFTETMAFQKEQAAKEERLRRGEIIAKTIANPNDMLAREYMLRAGVNGMGAGQEPQGQAVDIFSGEQINPGQMTTQSALAQQNVTNSGMNVMAGGQVGAQVPAAAPAAPAATPAAAPAATPAQPEIPRMEEGTPVVRMKDGTEYGRSRVRFAILGDKGKKPLGTEELQINHGDGSFTVIPNRHLSEALKMIKVGALT